MRRALTALATLALLAASSQAAASSKQIAITIDDLPVDLPSGRYGPSWLTRWAKQRGTKLSVYGHADPSGETARQAAQLCGG